MSQQSMCVQLAHFTGCAVKVANSCLSHCDNKLEVPFKEKADVSSTAQLLVIVSKALG